MATSFLGLNTSSTASRPRMPNLSQDIRNVQEAERQRQQRGGGYNDAQARANDNRAGALRNTEQRAERILNDSAIGRAMGQFEQAMTQGPYSDDVQNRIRGQAADSNAAAEAAQNAMLERQMASSGGSIDDPSYQAALRGNLATRQLANSAAANQVAIQAALANFQAGQQGARDLATTRAGQYGLGNPLAQQAASFYNTPVESQSNPAAPSVMPQTFQYRLPATQQTRPATPIPRQVSQPMPQASTPQATGGPSGGSTGNWYINGERVVNPAPPPTATMGPVPPPSGQPRTLTWQDYVKMGMGN